MTRTGNQVIQVLQSNRMPWLPTASGVEYLNRVHGTILALVPDSLRATIAQKVSVAFSVGEQEKVVSTPMNQVEQAIWVPNSGDKKVLSPLDIVALNRGQASPDGGIWRGATNATPSSFYVISTIGGQFVGLNVPTSAAGNVELYGSKLPATLDGTETLPPFPNDNVYIEGISYHAAHDRGMASVARYYNTFQLELAIIKKWLMTMAEGFQDNETNLRNK